MSYIQIAKVMYIATRVASLHHSSSAEFRNCVILCDDLSVFQHKKRSIVQLSSLALRLPENVNTPPSWTSTGQLRSLAQKPCLFVDEACTHLPNISPTLIETTCNVETGFLLLPSLYRLEDLVKLSFDRCSSIEQYQTAIIKDIEKDSSEMVQYLSSTNRSSRLVCIAKGFYSAAKRDSILVSLVKDDHLIAQLTECLADSWTYNPFYHKAIVNATIDVVPGDDTFATRQWIDETAWLATRHSVINLLIKGILRTEQAEDYFTAILEYTKLWKSLPQSSRPRRDDLYSGLGTYILGSSQASDSHRIMSSVELLDAMQRYGSELAANASPKS
eukprot:scpid70413/ scgid28857/ 